MNLARAPSNIALIKYMGKEDTDQNLPANPSLSVTLDRLCTYAEVREGEFKYLPERPAGAPLEAQVPDLSRAGVERILAHVERVEKFFPQLELTRRKGQVGELRTANTFPLSAGMASSASAFAAVTLATARALAADAAEFDRRWHEELDFRMRLAAISRAGSGSSCRSFFGPWVVWQGAEASPVVEPGHLDLTDLVIVVGREPKSVASGSAHRRVKTSPLWRGRVERAQARLRLALTAVQENDYSGLARVSWEESWEMHSLFHTSRPSFSYWTPDTVVVLRHFDLLGDARPIVTMDAGPNVHCLVRTSEADEWHGRLKRALPQYEILRDTQGRGADFPLA